jgi:hypothetical protein
MGIDSRDSDGEHASSMYSREIVARAALSYSRGARSKARASAFDDGLISKSGMGAGPSNDIEITGKRSSTHWIDASKRPSGAE